MSVNRYIEELVKQDAGEAGRRSGGAPSSPPPGHSNALYASSVAYGYLVACGLKAEPSAEQVYGTWHGS